ncbi:MAG: hypothetical protein ABIO16_01435, partial [Nocardioides sp.]
MSGRRWGLLLGIVAICGSSLTPASPAGGEPVLARAALGSVHATGTISYAQPNNLDHPEGATASWAVDGDALLLLQEAPLVGITNTAGL